MSDVHLTPDQLEEYVLDPIAAHVHEEHLSTCGECQARLAVEAQRELALIQIAKSPAKLRRPLPRGLVAGVIGGAMAAVLAMTAFQLTKADEEGDVPKGPPPAVRIPIEPAPNPGLRPADPVPAVFGDDTIALLIGRKESVASDVFSEIESNPPPDAATAAKDRLVLLALTGRTPEQTLAMRSMLMFDTDLCKMSATRQMAALAAMAEIYTAHAARPADAAIQACPGMVANLTESMFRSDTRYEGTVTMLAKLALDGNSLDDDISERPYDDLQRRVMKLEALARTGTFHKAEIDQLAHRDWRLDPVTGAHLVDVLAFGGADEIELALDFVGHDSSKISAAAKSALDVLSSKPGAIDVLAGEMSKYSTLRSERAQAVFHLLDMDGSPAAVRAMEVLQGKMQSSNVSPSELDVVEKSIADWKKRGR